MSTTTYQDWHNAVDSYINSEEFLSSLSAVGMFDFLKDRVDATTIVESSSAIEDYFERKISTLRGLGLDLRPPHETLPLPSAVERKDWHDGVDAYIFSKESGGRLSIPGLHDFIRRQIGAEKLIESASAIHNYYHQKVALMGGDGAEADEAVGSPVATNVKKQKGSPSKAASKGMTAAAADTPQEQKRSSKRMDWHKAVDSYINANKGGSLSVSGLTDVLKAKLPREMMVESSSAIHDYFHQRVASLRLPEDDGSMGDRQDWHNAVDSYINANKGGSLSVGGLTEALEGQLPGEMLINSSSAIHDYFHQRVASLRLPELQDEEGEEEGEGMGRQDWHDVVDNYIAANKDKNLTVADLTAAMQNLVPSATLVESAAAIHDHFHSRVAALRLPEPAAEMDVDDCRVDGENNVGKKRARSDADEQTNPRASKAAKVA